MDIITGGSPCQDLSIAGKRAGLAGERSGLFMEQIRVIKEMRENDKASGRTDVDIRPRFMVWENVPGAFSSNHGEDFKAVLEETAKIADSNAFIPEPPKGKWTHAGCIMGDGWSIAWRVHDAQFWGVPQRRKRISLVADFAGGGAPEILFERESMSGDTTKSREKGQGTTSDAERSVRETSKAVAYRKTSHAKSKEDGQGWQETKVNDTLNAFDNGESRTPTVVVEGFDSYNISLSGEKGKTLQSEGGGTGVNEGCVLIENYPNDSRVKIREDGKVQTLSSKMGTGGGNVPLVFGRQHDVTADDITPSLCAKMGTGGNNVPMVMEEPTCTTTEMTPKVDSEGVAFSLRCRDYKDPQCVAYANDAYDKWSESEKGASLRASGGVYGGGSESLSVGSVVRRLTPLECERLQGYPDGWTDIGEWYDSKGKKHKDADSPRYKALGNSIALPFWQWMAERMVKYISHEPTMASLFDGIGGFPLVYSRVGCQPIWSSEIEEFPMAVTKKHFGDDDLGLKGDYEQYL